MLAMQYPEILMTNSSCLLHQCSATNSLSTLKWGLFTERKKPMKYLYMRKVGKLHSWITEFVGCHGNISIEVILGAGKTIWWLLILIIKILVNIHNIFLYTTLHRLNQRSVFNIIFNSHVAALLSYKKLISPFVLLISVISYFNSFIIIIMSFSFFLSFNIFINILL